MVNVHLRDLMEEEIRIFQKTTISLTIVHSLKIKFLPEKRGYERKWFTFMVNHLEEQTAFKEIEVISQDQSAIIFKVFSIEKGETTMLRVENISSFNSDQI